MLSRFVVWSPMREPNSYGSIIDTWLGEALSVYRQSPEPQEEKRLKSAVTAPLPETRDIWF
jgi:hypothetical protein